jgi:hypothetical protein
MITRRNSVIDARGTRRRVLEMRAAAKPNGLKPKDVARPGDVQSHAHAILASTIPMTVVLYLTLVPGLVLAGVHPWRAIVGALWVFPYSLLAFGVPMGLWVRAVSWRSPSHAQAALLAKGICPHCAHGIGRIPPEPDGCTVCPECGAAWKEPNQNPNKSID